MIVNNMHKLKVNPRAELDINKERQYQEKKIYGLVTLFINDNKNKQPADSYLGHDIVAFRDKLYKIICHNEPQADLEQISEIPDIFIAEIENIRKGVFEEFKIIKIFPKKT